jgi:hypothetical protein
VAELRLEVLLSPDDLAAQLRLAEIADRNF